MAAYKVIQDIEAEDHILGPLTLRQFIYALVAAFCFYLCFISLSKHVPFFLALFMPPAIFFGFFAFPFGKDQPTEVWALAKIRFLFKPRRRIWDQSGVKELVTITVPRKIERIYTDGLSQTEVRSRLKALANTIDSRGWAVKNVNVNLYSQPGFLASAGSDRLIDVNNIPQAVPDFDVQAADDMLDEHSNPVAQQFDQMIQASSTAHRQQLIDEMNAVRAEQPQPAAPPAGAPNDYWFMNQPASPAALPADQATFKSQVVQPGTDSGSDQPVTAAEQAVIERLKAQNASQNVSYSHLRTLQPLGAAPAPAVEPVAPQPAPDQAANAPVTASPDAAILNLANNNDLNVATLAREAHKAKNSDEPPENEVVISLR